MLTNDDIIKIIDAEKEVFPTKEDFNSFKDEIKEDFSKLETSVDTINGFSKLPRNLA